MSRLNRARRPQFLSNPQLSRASLLPALPTGFVHLSSFVFTEVANAVSLPLLHLQFSYQKKFSLPLSNRWPCIGNKLTCQPAIACVWSAISSFSPSFPPPFPHDYLPFLSFFFPKVSLLFYLLSPPIILVIIFFPERVLCFSITPLPLPPPFSLCSLFLSPRLWGDVWSLSALESMGRRLF